MPSKNKIPQWEQYEWLIFKIFHDDHSSLITTVLKDTRLIGQYSERSRQIDILIKSNNNRTMIECKYHSRPVDIKTTESFLSMFSDVNADFGILISSSGFTRSARNRINEFKGKITLEYLDWEKAYTSFNEYSYGKITDLCGYCLDEYESGKEVPGLLCWESPVGAEIQGKVSMFFIGKCLKCGNHTVYCDSCGWVTIKEHGETCCELRDVFLELHSKQTQRKGRD